MKKLELKHYVLISFTLKNLPQKDKVKVLRKLYGYEEKKGSRLYCHQGLSSNLNAKKLGSNVILASIKNLPEFVNFFSKSKYLVLWLNQGNRKGLFLCSRVCNGKACSNAFTCCVKGSYRVIIFLVCCNC